MLNNLEKWHPGSFTKNFGWRQESNGLQKLHRAIRVGFADSSSDVPRNLFRKRIEAKNINFFIPANFFLFNYIDGSESWIAHDELVFQALKFSHTTDFDKLAMFTFNLTLVGRWKGAHNYQSRPALWSNRYIVERLAREHNWDTTKVNADDIQEYLKNDARYQGRTTRKLSTNLAYLYRLGRLEAAVKDQVERWWMNAVFLAADRVARARISRRLTIDSLEGALRDYDFFDLAGGSAIEKRYAFGRLLEMYVSVGGPDRFQASGEKISSGEVNDPRPYGLVDKKLPRAPKTLPAGVANIFKFLDNSYEQLNSEDLDEFEVEGFVRQSAVQALANLRKKGFIPSTNSEDLMNLMRD